MVFFTDSIAPARRSYINEKLLQERAQALFLCLLGKLQPVIQHGLGLFNPIPV